MTLTTIELVGLDKDTGDEIVVPVGTRLSDIYAAGHGPCLDLKHRPHRFMALAHLNGRRVRVAVDKTDFK